MRARFKPAIVVYNRMDVVAISLSESFPDWERTALAIELRNNDFHRRIQIDFRNCIYVCDDPVDIQAEIRLGVEAMALYHYFPNKAALLEAMATAVQDVRQIFGGFLAGVELAGMSAGERIVAVGLRYIEFALTYPAHFDLLFHVLPLDAATWEDFVAGGSTFRVPLELVQAGVNEGTFTIRPSYGVDEMAYSFWALVHGLAVLRKTRLRDLEADFDSLDRAALEALVRAFES